MKTIIVTGEGRQILGPWREDKQRTVGTGFETATLRFPVSPNGVSLYMNQSQSLFQCLFLDPLLAFSIVVPIHSSCLTTFAHIFTFSPQIYPNYPNIPSFSAKFSLQCVIIQHPRHSEVLRNDGGVEGLRGSPLILLYLLLFCQLPGNAQHEIKVISRMSQTNI